MRRKWCDGVKVEIVDAIDAETNRGFFVVFPPTASESGFDEVEDVATPPNEGRGQAVWECEGKRK